MRPRMTVARPELARFQYTIQVSPPAMARTPSPSILTTTTADTAQGPQNLDDIRRLRRTLPKDHPYCTTPLT